MLLPAKLLLTLSLIPSAVFALPVPAVWSQAQPVDAVDFHSWTTDRLVQQGTYSLRHGKRLENAIGYFTEAAKREPTNARWETLLGCAQAQRAYTLSLAVVDRRMYEEHLADWQAAQKDARNSLHGKTVLRDFPRTVDDDKRFEMTPEAASARIKELSLGAQASLEVATTLWDRDVPAVQAELANLKGWALLLLWRDPRRVVPDSWPTTNGKEDSSETIIAALELATKLQPESDTYLQALSDGCILAARDPNRPPWASPPRVDSDLNTRGISILRQLAERKPRQGAFWFRISSLEGRVEIGKAMTSPRSPESIEALQRAMIAEPGNALYAYMLAAAKAGTDGDVPVIESIQQGNAGGQIIPIRYHYAVPLDFAWAFPPEAMHLSDMDVSIMYGLLRWLKAAQKEKSSANVTRELSAVTGMARKFSEAQEAFGLSPSEKRTFQSIAQLMGLLRDEIADALKNDFPDVPSAANP